MALIKFAGKDPSANAKGVSVDENGNIYRGWKTYEASSNDSDTVSVVFSEFSYFGQNQVFRPKKPIGNYGLISLRIENNSDATCALRFCKDVYNGTQLLKDANGNNIEVECAANCTMIITPDDAPVLNYLRYPNIQVRLTSTPTDSATIIVTAIAKG